MMKGKLNLPRSSQEGLGLLSFDIEDWFCVENLKQGIKREEWNLKELRVVDNTKKILNILDLYNTKATFFILGWIAEKLPELVKEICNKGHEIASHGYGHELIYNLTKEEFRNDIIKSKKILEDITGEEVIGYRAPNFSITDWSLDILKEEGFIYDSSLFEASFHDRYGKIKLNENTITGAVEKFPNGIFEVLISTLNIAGKKIPWGGGGYFRLIPFIFYKYGVKKILKQKNVFVFYLHPWELDPDQPRVKNIKFTYYLRHYTNLDKTESKLKKLLREFSFKPVRKALREYLSLNKPY